jgi:hypothetical protein
MIQKDFSEPPVRINTEPAARYAKAWREQQAWEKYAQWMLENFATA